MKRPYKAVLAVAVLAGAVVLGAAIWEGQRAPGAFTLAAKPDAKRGEYLIRAGGCVACHTEEAALKEKGPILGGGRALKSPFGTFHSPNISADPTNGIGKWTDAQFVRAFRDGRSPSGHNYFPAFPYTSFTGATDQDLVDIKAHIFTLPPQTKVNKPHEVGFPYNVRFGLTFWKWLNFERGPMKPDPAKSAEWNRGAYLVNSLAHCGECHTPRGSLGGSRRNMAFAGADLGAEGIAPNITPDEETGIGKWSEGDIVSILKSGFMPDGNFAGSSMADVISHGTSHLSDDDLKAMAVYLKSLKPIRNKVEKKK